MSGGAEVGSCWCYYKEKVTRLLLILQGDSGGPMVCNGALAGIISWGYRCATAKFPGVYTDIRQYRQWLAMNCCCGCWSGSLLIFYWTFVFSWVQTFG